MVLGARASKAPAITTFKKWLLESRNIVDLHLGLSLATKLHRSLSSVKWLQRWLRRAVPATPQERAAVLWSFAYFFTLLAGYYVLRPLRDEMGIAGGVKALPWMFTATFITLLVAQPLYGALVARLPRRLFIPLVYHFFVANLALFWLLLTSGVATVIVARVFFVWVSVFNLFAVAVFWSFMADLFTSEQGKRLFGFIGAGGTAGALLGPVITIGLSAPLGPINLLIAAIAFLELAVFCVHQLERTANARETSPPEERVGGSAFAALSELIRSPYLLGIGAWVSLLSFGATILYLEQANIVAATVHGASAQTRIFAGIDLAVGTPDPCDANLCNRAAAQAVRHRRCGWCAASGLRRRLRGAGAGAAPHCRGGNPGGAALDELRHRQSGAPGVLHGCCARGEVQGEKPDRRRHLSRLRRVVWLGV